jgi:hypothetical protein
MPRLILGPRSQHSRVAWPLTPDSVEEIDQSIQILYDDLRRLYEAVTASDGSGPGLPIGEADVTNLVADLAALTAAIAALALVVAAQAEPGAGFWSPLTNGDPINPELVFDSLGDTVAVWTAG